jgi:hypothetical protein
MLKGMQSDELIENEKYLDLLKSCGLREFRAQTAGRKIGLFKTPLEMQTPWVVFWKFFLFMFAVLTSTAVFALSIAMLPWVTVRTTFILSCVMNFIFALLGGAEMAVRVKSRRRKMKIDSNSPKPPANS